jgi:hypothetical protein
MPTETDDNSKSLILAGLGRQCMCFWTISRPVIYQIPAGGTKKGFSKPTTSMCNQKDKENSEYENFDNANDAASPLMLFNCRSKEGRLQEPYKFPESANILSSTSIFQNKLPLTIRSCHG